MFQCLECNTAISNDAFDDDGEIVCLLCGSTDIDLYIEPDRQLTVRDVYPAE